MEENPVQTRQGSVASAHSGERDSTAAECFVGLAYRLAGGGELFDQTRDDISSWA